MVNEFGFKVSRLCLQAAVAIAFQIVVLIASPLIAANDGEPGKPGGPHEPGKLGEAEATAITGIYGAVLPSERADVGCRNEGRITHILVKPGDAVEANQVVIDMDARELVARLAVAEQELHKVTAIMNDLSTVSIAKAQFAKADATYITNQKLHQKSELEVFRLQMDRNEKQASLDLATAKHLQDIIEVTIKREQLNLAKLSLEASVARSPVSGIVSEQLRYPGESVRIGEPILKIIQMSELLFRVELDIAKIPPHKIADYQIDVRFELATGESFTISNIRLDRCIPNNLDSQNYFAFALLQNTKIPDRNGKMHWRLRPGMSGELTFRSIK